MTNADASPDPFEAHLPVILDEPINEGAALTATMLRGYVNRVSTE